MTIYSWAGQSPTLEFISTSVNINHHRSKNIFATNCLFTADDERRIKNQPSSSSSESTRTRIGDDIVDNMQEHLSFTNKDACLESNNKKEIFLNDDGSIYTASTTVSFDSEDEDEDGARRVSFAECVVTDVWTRPHTPEDEISNLYYSRTDEERFREEYNFERRKKLTTFATFLKDNSTSDEQPSSTSSSRQNQKMNRSRYNISCVVVVHKDKIESFPMNKSGRDLTSTDNFFDTDSFWSGSIVWY